MTADPMALMSAGAQAWAKGLEAWGKMLGVDPASKAEARRTAASPRPNGRAIRSSTPSARPIWHFPTSCSAPIEEIDGLDAETRQKLRFAVAQLRRRDEPVQLRADQPAGAQAHDRDRGENLLKGLANMLNDIAAGQLTQTKPGAFEVGRNLATTPGKVINETPLYQLIQYTPTTDEVLETPVVIFPPWINRFYILDLTPEKSFVKWCVDQGISLFMVSWKSADESIAERRSTIMCSTGRSTRSTRSATCSTSRACTPSAIAWRARRWRRRWPISTRKEQAAKVKSATFFTAQVDFCRGGRPQAVPRRRDHGAARSS